VKGRKEGSTASLGWRWQWWAPARWVALFLRVRLGLAFIAASERRGRVGKGRGEL